MGTAPRPQPGPRARTAVSVIVVGALVGLVCGAFVVVPLVHTAFAPVRDVPGTVQLDLSAGRYMIYQRTGWSKQYGPLSTSSNHWPTIGPESVRVTDSTGLPVVVVPRGPFETINRHGKIFTSAMSFRASRRDTYTLVFAGESSQVIVTRSIGDTISARAHWLLGGLLGFFVLVVGGVMLVVGTVRRGRVERVAYVTAASTAWSPLPPAGWFPDPTHVARRRWWDGTRWTEHTS